MVNPSKTMGREKATQARAVLKETRFPDDITAKASGKYAYVLDRNGAIYLYPLIKKVVHDFSFLDKKQILAAGTLKIKKGKILELSNLQGNDASSISDFKAGLRWISREAFADNAQIFVYSRKKTIISQEEKEGKRASLKKIELPAQQYYEFRTILDVINKSITDIHNNVTKAQVPPGIFSSNNKSFARKVLLDRIIKEIDAIIVDKTLDNKAKKELLVRLNQRLKIQFAPILAEKTFFWVKRKSHTQQMIEMHIIKALNTLNDAEFGRRGRFISAENDFVPSRNTDQTIYWMISRFLPDFIRKILFKTDTDKYREDKTKTYSSISTAEIQVLAPPFESAEKLSDDKLREYARQVMICNSSTSSLAGNLTAVETTHVFMENIVAINGHYNTHAQISAKEHEHLSTISDEARAFFEVHFPPELSRQLIENNGAIIDDNTGLVANILYEKNINGKPTLHVVFGGTGAAGFQAQNMSTNLSLLVNPAFIPASFTQARDLVGLVKRISGDHAQVEVKGFSLGGAFAAYAGLSHQLKTVCLSPVPLPPIIWRDLANRYGRNLRHLVENHIVNLTVEGDLATHWKFAKLGRAIEGSLFDIPHVLLDDQVFKFDTPILFCNKEL